MITVQLLGGACLRSGDAPLAGPPAQRHRIALLALVVGAWPHPLSRDRAMALLWPERDKASARRLLNLAVHVLRAALGESAIVSTGEGLLFEPSAVRCDLHAFRAAVAGGAADDVVRLYAGPLLDGFHLGESTEFGYWLDERRRELEHAYVGALRAVAAEQERSGDVHAWVGTARRLLAVDPYSAAYVQELMRALDARGDRAAAIQVAGDHARRLRTDLDIEPEPRVLELSARLQRAATARERAPESRETTRPTAVAVLPFLNLGVDQENDFFADGVTEDVIAQLSRIRSIRVISRTSVMQFRHRQRSVKDIAAALGATAVLDGSVRHAGDRVRVVATLIDPDSGQQLWSETYDRQLTDVFAIQTDVALQIAGALRAELSGEEQERLRRRPTRDLHAYQFFLQGRQSLIRYTPDGLTRALEYFDQSIGRDPEFALAHAQRAMALTELAEHGAMAPDEAYRRASEAVATALRLDPDLGAAHCTRGHLKTVSDLDWAGAEREFRRALELNPSDADSYDLFGRLCAALGRYDEAIALQQRALELDPLAHRLDIVTTLVRAGRYDEAIRRAGEAVELDPGHARARATLGWAYFLSGRKVEGLRELERAAAISPADTLWSAQLGEAYAMAGQTTRAREILSSLEERAKGEYVSPYHFAYVHTGLGESDMALRWLERAVADRAGPAYGIRGSFLFAPLQSHPRFRALLRQMNLD